MGKSNKSKNFKKLYRQLRIKEDTGFSHQYILDSYGVDSEFLKNSTGDKITIGFDTTKIENLLTDFINDGWNIISVSEDSSSICFHLVADEEE
jgi:hypothetical protein